MSIGFLDSLKGIDPWKRSVLISKDGSCFSRVTR